MRDPTLPESGAQAFESISKYVLRCSNVLHCRLRRFRAGHLAFATLHGHYDLRGSHSVTNTVRTVSFHVDGATEARRLVFVTQSAK